MSRGLEVSSVSRRYDEQQGFTRTKGKESLEIPLKILGADLFPSERDNLIIVEIEKTSREISRRIEIARGKINLTSRSKFIPHPFVIVSSSIRQVVALDYRRWGEREILLYPFVRVGNILGKKFRLENVKKNLLLSSPPPRRNLIDHPFRQFQRIEIPPRRRRRGRKSFLPFLFTRSIN